MRDKKIIAIFICLCCWACFLNIYPVHAKEGGSPVTVVGNSWLNGLAEEAALILAKSEAKRRALELAGRTMISSSTETKNMLLVSDVVLIRNTGVITNLQWGEHWIEDGKIFIELTAEVIAEKLNSDYMAIAKILRENDMPRVGIIIKSEIASADNKNLSEISPYSFYFKSFLGGVQLYFLKVTPAMDIKYLSGDMRVDGGNLARAFSSSARSNSLDSSRESLELEAAAESEEALALIKASNNEYGVDLLVVGTLRIYVNKMKISGVDTIKYNISPHIEVIQASNNKTLAVIEDTFSSYPVQEKGAHELIMKTLKRIGLRAGRALMGQLVGHWADNRDSLIIVAKDADTDMVYRLEDILKKLGGEQRFVIRSLSSRFARIEFYSDQSKSDIIKFLKEQDVLDISIDSILEGKIIVNIDKGWF